VEFENHKFAAFIADYITEEIIRGNTHIDRWMILDAIEAYKGGAANKYSIFIEWCIDDVKDVRPDLDDEQAMEVLEFVKDRHDATIGITWRTLEYAADYLYPEEVLP
jgi:hypothetical protein